ncbi:MAG: EpsG family protein [Erysipelotrichia bacterium]|nr:EpsG family protein [Erysipelotrichia bacterium]
MYIYIIELIIIFMLGLMLNMKKISKRVFVYASSIFLGIVLGLRGINTGRDTVIYVNIFNYIKNLTWNDIFKSGYRVVYNTITWLGSSDSYGENVELGYAVLNKLFSTFITDHTFILLISLAICILFGNFIYKNNRNHVFLAFIVFMCEALYMNSFNLFRQLFAMSIAINSIQCFKDNKYKRGIIRIALGSLIHLSCVTLFILVPLMKINEKKHKDFFRISVICAVSMCIFFPIARLIMLRLLPRYTLYLTKNFWEVSIGGTVIVWALGIILICLYYFKQKNIDKDMFIAMTCFVIYLAFEVMGFSFTMLSRVALYFRFSHIMLFSNIDTIIRNRTNKQIYVFVLVLLLVLEYLSYTKGVNMEYSFFWRSR